MKSPQVYIRELRAAIHAAEPPYERPHDYMNVDRPLTPLKHKTEPGVAPSRMQILRHALYLLDETEKHLQAVGGDLHQHSESIFEGIATVMSVAGMLSAIGIEALEPAA